MMFKHKRVAIDFDGTLFEDCGNIDQSFEKKQNLNVKADASEVTQWLKKVGFEILIFTCRPDYHRQYLEGLLKANRISFDYILFYTKPRVDLYIDDKGFRFETWQATRRWIQEKLSDSPVPASQEPHSDFEAALRKEKIKHLPLSQFKSILDVGCGSGSVWEGVTHAVLDGVEPDEYLGGEARKKGQYRRIFNNISETDCSLYDCVTLLGLLEHIPDDKAFLAQFADAKNLYLTVPNADSFHRQVGVELGMLNNLTELRSHDQEVGHCRYYTYNSFFELLSSFAKNNAFEVRFFGTTSFKFTSNDEMKPFMDRSPAIFRAAEKLGWTGKNAKYGAELVAYLRKAGA